MLPHQAVAEHPVGEVLVVAPEVVDGVDHAGELALPGQLLVQPIAGQPVGNVVILKRSNHRMSIKYCRFQIWLTCIRICLAADVYDALDLLGDKLFHLEGVAQGLLRVPPRVLVHDGQQVTPKSGKTLFIRESTLLVFLFLGHFLKK